MGELEDKIKFLEGELLRLAAVNREYWIALQQERKNNIDLKIIKQKIEELVQIAEGKIKNGL